MNEHDTDIEMRDVLSGLDQAPEHRPNFFAELREQATAAPEETSADTTRRKRRIALNLAAVGVAASVIALVAVVAPGNRQGPDQPPVAQPGTSTGTVIETVLASRVVEQTAVAYRQLQGLSARVKTTQYPYYISAARDSKVPGFETEQRVRIRANGDWWLNVEKPGQAEGAGPRFASFEAASATLRECFKQDVSQPAWSCGSITGNVEQIGRAGGQAIPELGILASALDELADANDAGLESLAFEGRDAWKVHASVDGAYFDDVTMIVDKQTNIPLQVLTENAGEPYSTTTLHDLVVNPAFQPSDFKIEFPKGHVASGAATDPQGPYVATPLAEIQGKVSYSPVLPSRLPEGYVLGETFTASDIGASGPQGENVANRSVVVAVYRRGLDSTVVTTRLTSGKPPAWVDPLAGTPGALFASQGPESKTAPSVALTTGTFAGVTAHATTGVETNRIWGAGPKLVFTVSGPVSQAQLIDIANSM